VLQSAQLWVLNLTYRVNGLLKITNGLKMKKLSMLIKILIGLTISGSGLLALILFMSGTSPSRPGSAQAGYPAPVDKSNVQQLTGYPAPDKNGTSTPSQSAVSVQATPKPLSKEAAIMATQGAAKLMYTPSASELADAEAEKQLRSSGVMLPLPPVIDYSYPINIVEDLPQVVYNYPLGEDGPYMPCVHAKEPGAPIFLKSISQSPDYYMIPFFKDGQVCALAIVDWQDGLGRFSSIMPADRLPFVEASEAITLVEQASGKKVTGTPILVQGEFQESFDPARPFWKVTTSDGQIYYVITRLGGFIEANTVVETVTTVIKAEDMHPLD
jgi:hypothetical protein